VGDFVRSVIIACRLKYQPKSRRYLVFFVKSYETGQVHERHAHIKHRTSSQVSLWTGKWTLHWREHAWRPVFKFEKAEWQMQLAMSQCWKKEKKSYSRQFSGFSFTNQFDWQNLRHGTGSLPDNWRWNRLLYLHINLSIALYCSVWPNSRAFRDTRC